MTGRRAPSPPLSRRESLLFEAGIKMGGIFHQYLGTPVAPSSAPALARAIEQAVRLQPFVERVVVRIDVRKGGPVGRGRFAYRYLTPSMLSVRVHLRDREVRVVAAMSYRADLRYPLMHVVSARSASSVRPTPRRPTVARRARRR